MPHGQIQVSIEGNPDQEALKFELELITRKTSDGDLSGPPQGQPILRRITLDTRVQGLADAAEWTLNKVKTARNLRNGAITFYDQEGAEYQKLEWTKGFIEKAEWFVDESERSEAMRGVMQYQFVVSEITIGGVALKNPVQ